MQLLIIILILILIFGGLPQVSGHWHNLGWGPSGLGIIVIIILFVLLLTGRL